MNILHYLSNWFLWNVLEIQKDDFLLQNPKAEEVSDKDYSAVVKQVHNNLLKSLASTK